MLFAKAVIGVGGEGVEFKLFGDVLQIGDHVLAPFARAGCFVGAVDACLFEKIGEFAEHAVQRRP